MYFRYHHVNRAHTENQHFSHCCLLAVFWLALETNRLKLNQFKFSILFSLCSSFFWLTIRSIICHRLSCINDVRKICFSTLFQFWFYFMLHNLMKSWCEKRFHHFFFFSLKKNAKTKQNENIDDKNGKIRCVCILHKRITRENKLSAKFIYFSILFCSSGAAVVVTVAETMSLSHNFRDENPRRIESQLKKWSKHGFFFFLFSFWL